MYLRFDATVRPISVAPLARAFGWPEFEGTLAGSIPDLQWAQGVVTLGGNLEAAVFDGSVVVRDLQLRDPLGKFPRLFASVDVKDLDLALVTSTFSFGMITGRLPGEIQVSRDVREVLGDGFVFEPRGPIDIKGVGMMETWLLKAERDTAQGEAA